MDLEVLGGVQKCSECGDGGARKDHGCAVYVLLDVLMEHRVVEAATVTAMETVRPWASRPRFNRCGSRLSSSGDGDGGCPALGLK